jgi:hypothetical protein
MGDGGSEEIRHSARRDIAGCGANGAGSKPLLDRLQQ